MKKRMCLAALGLLLLMGCTGIGPRTVIYDRFDYTGALGDSWKQQMLINMVKLRYGDTPVFLDVASIISGYTLERGVNVHGEIASPGRGDTFAGLDAKGTFTDRPTITYVPLSGEKFTRSLLKPIPPSALLSLIQAGYPFDLVMRVCVHSVNGIRNSFQGSTRARPADPEFYALLERLRRIQEAGAMDIKVQKMNEKEMMLIRFTGKAKASAEDLLFVKKTLGLNPSAGEFRIVYGTMAKDKKEIGILTRSLIECIINLASYIEVPVLHVQEKRVNPTIPEETLQGTTVSPLIKIYSSPNKPEDVFIAVPYRDYWFWIDDRDLHSKALFSFLMFMFSLTETGGKDGSPIITVPSG